MAEPDQHTLEFLLAFDGRIHHLEKGYWLKFEIKRVAKSVRKPHGLSYAFTLHDERGNRVLGFDNAHGIRAKGARAKRSAAAQDHWHRTKGDKGRLYAFVSADQLLADFFSEVRRILTERGISDTVVGESRPNRDDNE